MAEITSTDVFRAATVVRQLAERHSVESDSTTRAQLMQIVDQLNAIGQEIDYADPNSLINIVMADQAA